MKKLFCLILIIAMLIPIVSCGGAGDTDPDTSEKISDSVTESEEPDYDGPFKVGFARVDITPKTPIPLNTGDMLTTVESELYATCVAVSDGNETVLFYSLDVKNIPAGYDNQMKQSINRATGVPLKNIMLNAMHNHSAPTLGVPANNGMISSWTGKMSIYVAQAAKEAIADLSDATMFIGEAKSTNLAFVRRYMHQDGSFSSIHYRGASTTPVVAHETDADDNIQIVRFVREQKKDVLLVNWQAHVAHAIGAYPTSISGDYVYYLRRDVEEKNDDLLLAFFCGASGNINLTPKVERLNITDGNFKKVGSRLASAVLDALDGLEEKKVGAVKVSNSVYGVNYRSIDADRLEKANEIKVSGAEGSEEYNALLDKYGFKSSYEVNSTISIASKNGAALDITLGSVSFGDLAFVSVPYEMFDTNGMEVKEGSPFDTTFILSMTGDCLGYVPSALAVKNGGYEVYQSIFEYGTAEKVVAELLEMLGELKNKK